MRFCSPFSVRLYQQRGREDNFCISKGGFVFVALAGGFMGGYNNIMFNQFGYPFLGDMYGDQQQSPYGYMGYDSSPVASPVNSPARSDLGKSKGRNRRGGGGHGGNHKSGGGYVEGNKNNNGGGSPVFFDPDTPWEDVRTNIVKLSRSRGGTVVLKNLLQQDEMRAKILPQILEEMKGRFPFAMIDGHGSQFIRHLVSVCDDAQVTSIWKDMQTELLRVACTKFGSWAVQSFLDRIQGPEQLEILFKMLDPPTIIRMIRDPHGGHAISRLVIKLSADDSRFLFHAAAPQISHLCTHKYGCTTVQRMLETAAKQESIMMAGLVSQQADLLVKDQFGNYIVQHLIGLTHSEVEAYQEALLTRVLIPKFNTLARHKFGSNVIEKCLKAGGAARRQMMEQLLYVNTGNNSAHVPSLFPGPLSLRVYWLLRYYHIDVR